jgi:Outer membrane protein beta-barrel domain
MTKKLIILFLLLVPALQSDGQILISLIFGDKLNSEKLEFGLDGGINLPDIRGEDNGNLKGKFNLGFYFDFKFNNLQWMVHTGVMVKSRMGTRGLPVYSLDDSLLDSAFVGGSIERRLDYFNVPVLLKYKFNNQFYVQGGFMLGLMYNAKDIFSKKVIDKEDLLYTLDIEDDIQRIDAGLMGGIGYRLMGGHGMNLAIRYYYGLVNINKLDGAPEHFNQSVYFAVGIPIGAGKKKDKKTDD